MFEYNQDGIHFRCHEDVDTDRELKIDGEIPNFVEGNYFRFKESGNNPFDPNRDEIIFDSSIEQICFRVFDIVKKMYEENITERYSSLLVARLFETFAGYWSNILLANNHDRVGIFFWKKVLDIVKKWKVKNPKVFIHTGTPYFFLAENYLMMGDLDSAFSYLHEANYVDQQSWQWGHPDHMGAYCLAKLLDKPSSQMNYIVNDVRSVLTDYIIRFNGDYWVFMIRDFDEKFLKNENELLDIGYFFTFTFFSIIQNQRNINLESQENNFFKLRSLNLIFNLCLIIDEILKDTFLKNETNPRKKTMAFSNEQLSLQRSWTNTHELIEYWKENGKFDLSNPSTIIQMLLDKTETYDGNPVEKQVFTMIFAHVLRNYGAHNLNQESIVVEKYDEIINELMMALIISIDSIPD